MISYRVCLYSIPLNLRIFLQDKKGSKRFYNTLIKCNKIPSGTKKWNSLFDNIDKQTWDKYYLMPFRVTKNTKFQWFQYRVIHHILATNSLLFKIRIVISPLCVLCNSERETIIHLLWECQEVQKLLQSLDILLEALLIPFSVNKQTFIFMIQLHVHDKAG